MAGEDANELLSGETGRPGNGDAGAVAGACAGGGV
jgi:hypothetical protein